ncbi:type IV pilus assembly protein PilM [Patescibacteria group bacterium]|nr:type IV pilus assembly protein PilM [Patescibacteria group bacterium]
MFGKPKAFGLDLSDDALYLMEVKGESAGSVTSAAHFELSSGIVEDGKILDQEKLVEILRNAYVGAQPESPHKNNVVLGLPESQTYIGHFSISKEISKKELLDEVYAEAGDNMPIDLENAAWDYEILVTTENSYEILFAAASAEIVEDYEHAMNLAGLDLKVLEPEALALSRSLIKLSDLEADQGVAILDIGARTSNLQFVDKLGLQLSLAIPVAGNHFTTAIAEYLKIKVDQAEANKRAKGFSDARQAKVLRSTISHIVNEFEEARNYYEAKTVRKVTDVVLCGGSSAMPGIDAELQKLFGVAVSLGAPPFAMLDLQPHQIAAVSGFAMRARAMSPGINFIA